MRFAEFLLLLEGKYSDEHAFRKQWNFFVLSDDEDAKKVRDYLDAGEEDNARGEIQRILAAAKNNTSHPLHFDRAERGFKGRKTSGDQGSYDEMSDLVGDSVIAYSQSPNGKEALRDRLKAEVTGADKKEVSSTWRQQTGKTKDEPKMDIRFASPDGSSEVVKSLSLKQAGSQTLSAKADETSAVWRAAAKRVRDEMKEGGASEADIEEFDKDTENMITRLNRAQSFGDKTGKETFRTSAEPSGDNPKNPDTRRKELMQKFMDEYSEKYPSVQREFGREVAGGREKFKGGEGSADDTVVHKHTAKDGTVSRASVTSTATTNLPSNPRSSKPTSRSSSHPSSGDFSARVTSRNIPEPSPEPTPEPKGVGQDPNYPQHSTQGVRQPKAIGVTPEDRARRKRAERLAKIEKIIAKRKKEGKRTGPHFTNNQMGNGLPEDKYLKLSQGMKTFSEFVLECSQLDEGGLSRLVGQAKKKGVAVLSGTRGDKSSKENKARNQQLVKDIRGKGLPGPTKAKGKWEGGSERSHVVTSGKQGKRAFKDKIKSLGQKYNQDAVITQSPGKSATLTRTRKGGMDKKRKSIGKMRPGKSNPKNETQIKGKTFTYEK